MHRNKGCVFIQDYVINQSKLLGSGSTGHVYKGFEIKTGNPVAIKVIPLNTIDNQVSEYLFNMQTHALTTLKHPNILKGIHISQKNQEYYIVTQYCNGGTLKDLIIKEGFLNQSRALEIIEGILKGYSQCVKYKVIHRDIKPANIMLHDGQPKIIDFGYCMIEGFKKPSLQYNVGSPSYMAPESYKWNMYNQKTEIWAIGTTLYECVTGKTLDQGRKMSDTFKKIIQKGIQFPDHITENCKKLIKWCLQYDPKNRPTCSQLLSSLYYHQKQHSYSLLTCAESNQNGIARHTSQSLLYSTPPSSGRNLSFYNNINDAQKDYLKPKPENQIFPQNTLHESKMIGKTSITKQKSILNRNKYYSKMQFNPSLHLLKKQIETKPQKTYNYMVSLNGQRQPSMTYR